MGLPVARRFGMETVAGQALICRADRACFFWVLTALALALPCVGQKFPPRVVRHACQRLVLLATLIIFNSIGMSLRLSRVSCYTKQCLAVACIKFIFAPCCITGLAFALGLGAVEGGLPLRVVLVLSAMPVAMNALVPPFLYGLDVDLANACWIATTGILLLVLPVLLWLLPLL